jgi:oligoendopeptidase F
VTDGHRTGAEAVRWDLADLYAAPDDPALEQDIADALAAAEAFAARYRGQVGTLDAAGLATACSDLEAVWTPMQRAAVYAFLRFATDTGDEARGALVARVQECSASVETATLFFDLEWNTVPDGRAEALLAEAALGTYRHHLTKTRRYRAHQLSEPEERVLAELSPTGPAAWSRLFTQLEAGIRVTLDGADTSLEEALAMLHEPDRERRRHAAAAVTDALAGELPTRAFIYNTLLADKATRDRLRGHPHWLHSRNLDNEATDAQVEALVEAVSGRYGLVGRYYRLKARLLGVAELHDYDRYAPLTADEPAVAWSEARALVLDAYAAFSPELADLAREFFDAGWIDAALAKGKQGGAFAADTVPELHPYVLLNYTGRARDVLTLAHELGHGVHMRLAQRQTLLNTETPLTTAETASIFGETMTFAQLLAAESDPQRRLGLVARRLEDAFAAIFRQVAMHRFEDAVHTTRRAEGELSIEAFGDAWMRTQAAMFDGAVTLTDGYRTWWSYVPHFIGVPGYVYAYAYGNLFALALYRRYEEEGATFVPRYLELLAAGGSAAPEVLGSRVGVDLADPGFWDAGLDVLADEVTQAERLADEVAPG